MFKNIFLAITSLVGVILFFFLIGLLATGLKLVNLPFYQFNSNINRATGIIDKVNNPDRCLGINKEFQELKTEIVAVRDTQIPNSQASLDNFKKGLPEDRTKWDFQTSQAYSQLSSQLLGQQNYLASLKGKYEAFLNRPDITPCRSNLPTFIQLN